MVNQVAKYFIVIGLLCAVNGYAKKNSQELFLKANKLYAQEQYGEAYDMYNSLDPKGRAVWYNMGNCAYHLGHHSQAIVFWKRAQEGATERERVDIETNLSLAYKKIGKSYHAEPWYEKLLTLPLPPFMAQLLLVIAWYVLLWLLFFESKARTLSYYVMLLCIMLGVVWLSAVVYRLYQKERYAVGMVVKKQSALLAGPHTQYHILKAVGEIEEVVICDTRPGWYKVSSGDTYGWISVDDVELV